MAHYVVSSPRLTVWVQTLRGIITATAPITRMFVNQPLSNLIKWLEPSGEVRCTRILNWKTVLVCGGRDYINRHLIHQTLDCYHASSRIELLVQGGACGADLCAREWAEFREVPCVEYPADWHTYGKSAGPRRNRLMLETEKPDLVLAFPGGIGTANMISIARQKGTPVHVITELIPSDTSIRPSVPESKAPRKTSGTASHTPIRNRKTHSKTSEKSRRRSQRKSS